MYARVVIPNWNGRRYLEPLFEDLRSQTRPPAEIVVVDNGSTDGSREWVSAHGGRVIGFEYNRGFAAAVNEGVRNAECGIAAVLNNDLRLDPRWMEIMTAGLGNASFAVGKVLSLNDRRRIDGTFDTVCRGGTAWRCGAGALDGPTWSEARAVVIPPFTAVVVQRDVYLALGGLDEQFESYLEDVDFGLRCASNGHAGRYMPEALAWHAGSATLGRWHPRTVRQIARNQVFLIARHYTREMVRRYGWKIAVAHLLWGGLAFRHGCGLAWLRGKWEGLKRCREMRGTPSLRLAETLRDSEREMRALQVATGQDLYWRLYFALTGE